MKLTWKTCLKVAVSVLALYICFQIWPIVGAALRALLQAATPLFVGCIVAYAIDIPMSSYERHFFPKSNKKFVQKIRRPLCLVGAVISLLAIVALISWLVIPQLSSCVQLLWDQVPGFFRRTLKKAEELGVFSPQTIQMLESIDWPSKLGQIAGVVTSGIGDVAEAVFNTVSSVFSGVVTALVSVIFSVYLLLYKNKLKANYHAVANRYMKKSWIGRIDYVASVTNNCFHRFVVGQCTEAVILGVLCMLGMWILRLPYPTMVGALIAFTSLVPVVGSFIGGAVGAFMILMVSPVQALFFVIFLVILQQVEGNLIYPKVVGSSLGLPAIWVLAAVTLGGGVAGVAGMLIGVPLAASIYRIVRDDVRKKNQPEQPEE